MRNLSHAPQVAQAQSSPTAGSALSESSRDLANPRKSRNATVTLALRDHNGVLLRYEDGGSIKPFHVEQHAYSDDRERMALLQAERELLALRVITDCLDLSSIGRTRILDALEVIQRALAAKRPKLGMSPPAEDETQ